MPADVAHRLRVWAALRRTKAAHIVSELVCEAVPSEDQLAAQRRYSRTERAMATMSTNNGNFLAP